MVSRNFHREVSMLWILQNYVVTLRRNRSGANAVKFALIVTLVTVFIVANVLAIDHFLKISS